MVSFEVKVFVSKEFCPIYLDARRFGWLEFFSYLGTTSDLTYVLYQVLKVQDKHCADFQMSHTLGLN